LAVEGDEEVVVEDDPPVCAVVVAVDLDEGVGRSAD
jgi:hypothetical protein